MRVSCRIAPDASLLYCKIGNISVQPHPHFLFSTGTDLSSVEGRPLCRMSEVLISAKCTQISRSIASLCGSSTIIFFFCWLRIRLEQTQGVWPALCLRPDVFSQTSVSDQLVYADGVRHPKARTLLHSTHRRCITHLVSV